MLDWIKKKLFGRLTMADLYDRCVVEFAQECKQQGCVPESYDNQARAFLFANGTQFQLGNLFAEWRTRDPHGRAELIASFVRSIIESDKDADIVPEKLPEELMPGIRARVLISNTLLRGWLAGAPPDNSIETAWLPFTGDLAACVLRSRTHSMSQMTRSNLAFADLPIDRAMPRAMANFRASIPVPLFEPLGHGVYGCSNLADHQSALLLLEPGKDYALPELKGEPVALVPERNLFYLTGSTDTAGLTKLLDIAAQAKQMPNFCSSVMLQWTGGLWSEFRFDPGSVNAARQQQIARDEMMFDYGYQKQGLDQFHLNQGLDVFVSNIQLYEQKDTKGAMFTVTTLASGTRGTLLPRADRLGFGKQTVDPNTGLATGIEKYVVVAWSDAMDIAGHLFEPVAELYPPRFRARSFPDAETWARLEARQL
jgi:hypothetical protein